MTIGLLEKTQKERNRLRRELAKIIKDALRVSIFGIDGVGLIGVQLPEVIQIQKVEDCPENVLGLIAKHLFIFPLFGVASLKIVLFAGYDKEKNTLYIVHQDADA